MKRWMFLGLAPMAALLVLAGMSGCGRSTDPWAEETGTPRVVVTIAPLYSFVKGVTGKQAAVKCLCTTTGPHHYSADSRDAQMLEKADVVFGIGLKLDDTRLTEPLIVMSRRKDLTYVKLGEKLPEKMLRELEGDHDHDHDKDKDKGGHHHDHGKTDPHVWLGIPEVIKMVEAIRDELVKVDEAHAGEYKENAEKYILSLKRLEADGKQMLADKKNKRIVSFHDALGYFARTFSIEVADVIELGPGDEPTAKHLAELVELCRNKEKPVAAITVEPQYPKSSSAAIVQKELKAKDVAIELVTVDPLETADPVDLKKEGAGWYEARIRQNLKALADVLR
jgi:ABC-type Zn uptake system ZnuABC Zn-binding protein ZnuA